MRSDLKLALVSLTMALAFLFSRQVLAEDYHLLEPLPFISDASGNATIASFLPGIVKIAIGVAGALAVIRIIIGGVQYVSTDAWWKKNDAKGTITSAVMGLLLAIGAYTILYTLNPKILDLNLTLERPASGGIDTNLGNKTAEDTGCTNNCVALDATEIPVKTPGACKNDPCYVNELMKSKLESLTANMEGVAGWQVTVAYPPIPALLDACYNSGSTAGNCVEVAPLLTATSSIKKLLDGAKTANFGPVYYIPAGPTASARMTFLQKELPGYAFGTDPAPPAISLGFEHIHLVAQ